MGNTTCFDDDCNDKNDDDDDDDDGIVAAMSFTFTVISFSTQCSSCMNCNCLDHASFMQYEHSVETVMTVKVQLMAVMKIESNKPPWKLSY